MPAAGPTAPDISFEVFGGVLEYDGSGYYPGLELLNLVFNGAGEEVLPVGDTSFVLRAHDFARKLVWSDTFGEHSSRRSVLYDADTENAIRNLMECLQLEIPSKPKSVDWSRAHFFPYTRSLIHWDAMDRGRTGNARVSIERRYLRGGGALAYHILRTDRNESRRLACSTGFNALYPSGDDTTPLETLAAVLADHGKSDEKPREDLIERDKTNSRNDRLEELYRDGIGNVLSHRKLSSVARIRALIGWTGLWLVLMQHKRAHAYLDRECTPIVCDCDSAHPQLRRAAQKSLKDAQATILDAFDLAYSRRREGRPPRKQRDKVRGFFWATAAAVKLLNAWRGRRHFTLRLDILETLVLAAFPEKEERTFEWFVQNWLYDCCGLVVGRSAAEDALLLDLLDASIFEDNELQLQRQMSAAGLLTEYSDMTRMVSAEGLV